MKIAELDLVTCVRQVHAAELLGELESGGFNVLALDGADISDADGFLAAVERDLPISAGLHADNWDALIDVLDDGLAQLPTDRVALVWRHADRLELSNMQDFLLAVRALLDVARRVYARADGRERELLLFLLGDGENYPAI